MTIPGYLEQAIFEGRAKAKVYSGGLNMQMVLKVPANSYIVIYGYYFRPYCPQFGDDIQTTTGTTPVFDSKSGTQYVLFKTNNDFYAFGHQGQPLGLPGTPFVAGWVDPTATARKFTPVVYHEPRQTYMVSNKDVGIAIAFINGTAIATTGGTVTNNAETLPPNLQYGNEFLDIFSSGYYDPILGNFYYPLNEPYSEQSGLPGSNVSQYQVFPRPSGSTIPVPTNVNAGNALYNQKFPLLTVMYVQFNEEMPQNLK